MNATERCEMAQAVPALNVQGVAYLLRLTVRRLGSVLGSREEVMG